TVHNEILNLDKNLKEDSEEVLVHLNKLTSEEFEKQHQDFFERIGAKKYKVKDEAGEKLSTYEITQKMIKEEKTLEEMAKEKGVKTPMILGHIEKLLDEKVITKKEIEYLKPETKEFQKMLKEVSEVLKKMNSAKLTPIFNALDRKYSFEQ